MLLLKRNSSMEFVFFYNEKEDYKQAPSLTPTSKSFLCTLLSIHTAETHKPCKQSMHMSMFAGRIFKQLLVLYHKSVWHTDVFFFCRLNPSRWMRRTRPTHWYLWPPCPRSPSTNPLLTESLHQKTGPTPARQLTGTLPVWPLWLTLRCESHFHLCCCRDHLLLPFSSVKHSACLHRLEHPSYNHHIYATGTHFRVQDTGVSWFQKSGYDVYIPKHKNLIPKNPNPIKTGILKSI